MGGCWTSYPGDPVHPDPQKDTEQSQRGLSSQGPTYTRSGNHGSPGPETSDVHRSPSVGGHGVGVTGVDTDPMKDRPRNSWGTDTEYSRRTTTVRETSLCHTLGDPTPSLISSVPLVVNRRFDLPRRRRGCGREVGKEPGGPGGLQQLVVPTHSPLRGSRNTDESSKTH